MDNKTTTDSKQFREQIRLLERRLGLLNKNNNGSFSCCKVTLPQCHALVEIGRAKTISLKKLAKILTLDTSTTSRTVDGLVKKGYVTRIESSLDRRSIDISLTPTGQTLFCDIEHKMDNNFAQIFNCIPNEEKENVLHAMNCIIDAFSHSSSC